MEHRETIKNVDMVLVEKTECEETFGRPRCRQEDNIKMNIKE